jgi:hypothetical protein
LKNLRDGLSTEEDEMKGGPKGFKSPDPIIQEAVKSK